MSKTNKISVKIFWYLLTVAHSFPPYVVPFTTTQKVIVIEDAEESS